MQLMINNVHNLKKITKTKTTSILQQREERKAKV